MADINTDVLIIGTGPAGSSMAALLSTYGVENMVINRYRWLANTPRAHITNQRTMEVLRDLFKHEADLDPISLMVWRRLVHWVGDLADYSEKVGNRLRLLVAH